MAGLCRFDLRIAISWEFVGTTASCDEEDP